MGAFPIFEFRSQHNRNHKLYSTTESAQKFFFCTHQRSQHPFKKARGNLHEKSLVMFQSHSKPGSRALLDWSVFPAPNFEWLKTSKWGGLKLCPHHEANLLFNLVLGPGSSFLNARGCDPCCDAVTQHVFCARVNHQKPSSTVIYVCRA